jgi:hypothetical protein
MCYDMMHADHGLPPVSDMDKRAALADEWLQDSNGLPAMTGLVYSRALFELVGTGLAHPKAPLPHAPRLL